MPAHPDPREENSRHPDPREENSRHPDPRDHNNSDEQQPVHTRTRQSASRSPPTRHRRRTSNSSMADSDQASTWQQGQAAAAATASIISSDTTSANISEYIGEVLVTNIIHSDISPPTYSSSNNPTTDPATQYRTTSDDPTYFKGPSDNTNIRGDSNPRVDNTRGDTGYEEDATDSSWNNEFKIPQEPVSAFNPFVNLPGQIQTPPGQPSQAGQHGLAGQPGLAGQAGQLGARLNPYHHHLHHPPISKTVSSPLSGGAISSSAVPSISATTNSGLSPGEPVERGRSLPRNIEAPPASSTPLSAAGAPASSWGASGSVASPWGTSSSVANPWVVGGGVSASPLLKKAQINVASRAAKEELFNTNTSAGGTGSSAGGGTGSRPVKSHARSMSHGGVHFRTPSVREREYQAYIEQQQASIQDASGGLPGVGAGGLNPAQPKLPSALKKPGHRRVFSHGGEAAGNSQPYRPGHNRSGSRTDFLLPPDHEERERKKIGGTNLVSNRPSISHKRNHSRTDSITGFFRGHSRQNSRSDSIYTLRQTTTNYKKNVFFWNKPLPAVEVERKHRTVVPNHLVPGSPKDTDHPNNIFLANNIRTTKYTLLSFLPKNLFEQFHRFANLYFLFIVLLNWVPAINAFGKEISMLPVILVLVVTAIKDLFEDRRRYNSDKRVNNSNCRVFNAAEGRYMGKTWKDLRVGDIVHLSNNEMIPADILLLHSSDTNGLCFIDTQNLDGETNLKQREKPRGLKMESTSNLNVQELRANLECDAPSTKIYRFHGSLVQPWGERIPVGKDNLILRECILKNTDYIEGLVVYAGHETKAMLNNGGPRYKRSKLERQMNTEVLYCVLILITLCLMGALGAGLWIDSFEYLAPFLTQESLIGINALWEGFLAFWTFIIILQIIIPLSLYVTIELTKLSQVYLIHNDPLLYDHVHDKRVECRALNIPEELGQVQYMFCDKTGTLTENKMIFKRCSINGNDYGHNSFSTKASSRAVIPVNPKLAEYLNAIEINKLVDSDKPLPKENLLVQEFFFLLAVCNTVIVAKKPHRDTMNANGIIQDTPGSDDTTLPRPFRNSLSPRAAVGGVTPSSREGSPSPPPSLESTVSSTAGLTTPLPQHQHKRPKFLDFLPAGARPLSPIQSSPETSPNDSPASTHRSLKLSSILNPISRLTSYYSSTSLSKVSRTTTPTPGEIRPIYEAESPDELALVDAAYAYNIKLINRAPQHMTVQLPGDKEQQYQILHVLPFDSVRKRMSIVLKNPNTGGVTLYCKGADSSMYPRLSRPRNKEEEALLDSTEKNLETYSQQGLRVLVMANRELSVDEYEDWSTQHIRAENALEKRDKLLMESYNAIETKMTLLGATGIEDKLQEGVPDAIYRLRQAGIVVWVLTGDKQETAINIAFSCKLFNQNMEIIKLNSRSRDAAETSIRNYLDQAKHSTRTREKRALVVDGKTLVYILDKRANIQELFLELTEQCCAVLGCRATPLQKAYIVRIVKTNLKMHTLAIGDGANDVSMIQTADIGVGISGQEGMQAVMAADFAISRFRFIERLLLVHGHWSYDRLARMVLHFFYKNATFVFVCFWYQIFNGWSGQVMIDQMYLMLFNLLFTSLPPVAIGVFDRNAPADLLIANPKLYSVGRMSTVYKPYSFWINMAEALYQSICLYFIAHGTYNGSNVGIWEWGTMVCSQCIAVMLVQLGVETKSWTIVHWLSMLISVGLYLAFGLIYNAVCSECQGLTNPYMVMQHSLADPKHYLVLTLTMVVSALPRVFFRVLENQFRPSDVVVAVKERRHFRDLEKKKKACLAKSNSGFISNGNGQGRLPRIGNNADNATTVTTVEMAHM